MSLREAGYIVHTASDAAEALHVFRRTYVDLVLLDLQLPNRDGHSVCAEIRKHSRTPIIIMSAYGAPDDIVYSFSQGADDHIAKPFQMRDVEVRIQRLLKRHNEQQNPNIADLAHP
jgi:DNA-binding response OmpR family regulator